jgi:hypothetical protein
MSAAQDRFDENIPSELSESEITDYERQARLLLQTKLFSWPLLWAIMAELNFVGSLGGAEYRRVTDERKAVARKESEHSA